jgi:hypothetical protein
MKKISIIYRISENEMAKCGEAIMKAISSAKEINGESHQRNNLMAKISGIGVK